MKMAPDPEERAHLEERDPAGDELVVDEEELIVIEPDRPRCPRCGWHHTRLSHTKTIADTVFKFLSLRAYRCRSCGNRFYKRPPAKA
jgi:hypothetical protein